MAEVLPNDILFRAGGATLVRYGVPGLKRATRGWELGKETFTRADASTCATSIDRLGQLRTWAANQLRLEFVDLDGDGVRETPGFVLEGSRTNLCLRSQDFANWSVIGTPTIGTAITASDLSLDLLGDDDGAALEYFYRSVTFTGNAVKAVSVFAKKGTSSSDEWHLQIFDNTAGTQRLIAKISWDGSGVPSVVMTVGSQIGSPALVGNGIYQFSFQTTSVTAANSHEVRVIPARLADADADTGNVYIGGVQVEDAAFPSSYIKTTTATVTRAADSLTFPIGFGPQDLTVYAKMARPVWADASGTLAAGPSVFLLGGDDDLFSCIELEGAAAGRQWDTVVFDAASGSGTRILTENIPAGATLNTIVQVRNLTTAPAVAIDAGAGLTAFDTGSAAFSSWDIQQIRLGRRRTFVPEEQLFGVLVDLVVAKGLHSLQELQAVP
jgi:hypothetical protein